MSSTTIIVENTRTDIKAAPARSELVTELLQGGAEFYGTFMFLFMAFAGVQSVVHISAATQTQGLVHNIAFLFGCSLTLAIWLTYRISGGALNPAVCFAVLLTGNMSIRKFGIYVVSECLGAIAAGGIVSLIFPTPFVGANSIQASGKMTTLQAVFGEMFGTFALCIVVLFLAVEKSKVRWFAPALIGLTVFVNLSILIPYTNGCINPARSLGSALFEAKYDWSGYWIFWVGPFAGAALAAGVWKFWKAMDYETLNAGQESEI